MMVILFLLLIAAIAYAAGWRPQFGQWVRTGNAAGGAINNAAEVLRERYARGEISREQYQEMRDELSR